MDFHHPLFRSLVLPLALAFAATGGLRGVLGPAAGRRWASAGAAFAIVATAAWLLGWRMPPGALTDKLPWIYAAAALAGLRLEAARAGPRGTWLAACVLWALALAVLGAQPLAMKLAAWCVGAVAAGAVLSEPAEGATAPASLAVASLGLAAVALSAGSALLFELVLALAAALAGCALWLWPVARIAFGPAGTLVSVIACLALAQGTALLTPARPMALLLLAGALLSAPMVRWGGRRMRASSSATAAAPHRHPWIEALVVAAVAAIWVAGAMAVELMAGGSAAEGGLDDPYYQPRW